MHNTSAHVQAAHCGIGACRSHIGGWEIFTPITNSQALGYGPVGSVEDVIRDLGLVGTIDSETFGVLDVGVEATSGGGGPVDNVMADPGASMSQTAEVMQTDSSDEEKPWRRSPQS